jgi:two-component system, chemotaxis family, protein-glutamate methylesterase/glutaminase
MIKVLIVEDSPVVRDLLTHILSSDPEITVIGTASNGLEAIEFVSNQRPDVVTMDITMPKMGGFEATRRIMETNPVPIVILTASWDPTDVSRTWKAMEAGAVHALEKPRLLGEIEGDDNVRELIQTVKLMSEVKVVRRWPRTRGLPTPSVSSQSKPLLSVVRIVAIGASTGGPPIIKDILSALPREFPVPVLLVQHMAPNFTRSFVDWLNQSTPLEVKVPTNGEHASPGKVFVGPDLFQMKINRDGIISLTQDEPENGLRPSVSYLFRSVAEAFGKNAMGILLTGMGRDGAEELNVMRLRGAVTIAQDKDSSVVHGMPGEAIKMGAASFILSPQKIVEMLHVLASGGSQK